ncbi:hypothetical protein TNIN_201521 [Trichonephila inaurata madagascariensis]|uniref:Uncharacterized protein n=1 Tax=Trichonephila inaurata madagascariensis TaxID=2747483 RepID=A0A8X6WUE2_9ARAC|nr:hypothetical protein TNIN_201521 [Trichonephila inaurata madagascariensis]
MWRTLREISTTSVPNIIWCGKPHLTKDCKKPEATDPTCCKCHSKHPANFLGFPNNPLNKPPPPDKKKAQKERVNKRKEMIAKLRKNTSPTEKPNPVFPKPTVNPPKSPTNLYSQAATSSLPKENPPNSQASTSTEGYLATFKMFQDPDVKEMMQVLHKFLRISKSNKSRAGKFMEIASLLGLDLFA